MLNLDANRRTRKALGNVQARHGATHWKQRTGFTAIRLGRERGNPRPLALSQRPLARPSRQAYWRDGRRQLRAVPRAAVAVSRAGLADGQLARAAVITSVRSGIWSSDSSSARAARAARRAACAAGSARTTRRAAVARLQIASVVLKDLPTTLLEEARPFLRGRRRLQRCIVTPREAVIDKRAFSGLEDCRVVVLIAKVHQAVRRSLALVLAIWGGRNRLVGAISSVPAPAATDCGHDNCHQRPITTVPCHKILA